MALEIKRTAPRPETGERTRARRLFTPNADIYETDERVVLLVEMPGVAADGVDVSLEERVLTIRGRGREQAHPGYRLVYREYADGDYERRFELSEEINQGGIEASYKNGLLRLTLPKAGPAQAKKIEVKGA